MFRGMVIQLAFQPYNQSFVAAVLQFDLQTQAAHSFPLLRYSFYAGIGNSCTPTKLEEIREKKKKCDILCKTSPQLNLCSKLGTDLMR
jgi:hypothetical protein